MKKKLRYSIYNVRSNYCSIVICRTFNDNSWKMASPFNTEFDSATLSTSGQPTTETPVVSIESDPNSPLPAIPSTLREPTTRSPASSIESDPSNPQLENPSTSRQPVRPPLSSIECNPDNPSPEVPSSQQEEVSVGEKKEATFCQRVKIQFPLWKRHFYDFRIEISITTVIVAFILGPCIAAYLTPLKVFCLGITTIFSFVCFMYIWLKIPAGPPFLSDKFGNVIQPAYLLPPKLSASSLLLVSNAATRVYSQPQMCYGIMERGFDS